jgi:hypothetical protein
MMYGISFANAPPRIFFKELWLENIDKNIAKVWILLNCFSLTSHWQPNPRRKFRTQTSFKCSPKIMSPANGLIFQNRFLCLIFLPSVILIKLCLTLTWDPSPIFEAWADQPLPLKYKNFIVSLFSFSFCLHAL